MPPVTGVSLNNSTNTLISTGTVFVLQYKLKKIVRGESLSTMCL